MRRNRLLYAVAVLAVIAAGLASRQFPGLLPAGLGKYPGDALWALMIFLLIGFAKPGWSIVTVAVLALAVCCCVEFSQLYQAPWINSIRQTTPGHLVLGSTFGWQDLIAYAAGVLAGCFGEIALYRGRSLK